MKLKVLTAASLLANVVLLALLLSRGDVEMDRWRTVGGGSADLFDGKSLEGWWPLSDQWTVQDGAIVCPTSNRIQYLISERVVDRPFRLRYQVSILERSRSDGKIVGFVDAAGDNMLVAMDDDRPHSIQIDSGRKVFDESGIYGPWNVESDADFQVEAGKWYDVVCTVDGSHFTVEVGTVRLSHHFSPKFPVSIWLEVQRTGAKFRSLTVENP